MVLAERASPAGYVMAGALFCFRPWSLPVVPAFKCSQEVETSKGRGVANCKLRGGRNTWSAARKAAGAPRLLNFSTPQFGEGPGRQ